MKKNKLMFALTALVIASLACGINLNTGEGTQVPAPAPIQPVIDVCKNIEGNQSTVPSGYQVDVAGNCTQIPVVPPSPVAVDLCKNIEGIQSTVPSGYQLDALGNCNLIPPPAPVAIDVCKNIEGVQSTVPSGFTVDTAGNCTANPPPAPKNPIATANYQLDCDPYPTKRTNIWLDGVEKGKTMEIIGKNTELGLWYQVKWKSLICWVDSAFVTVSGDTSAVPTVSVTIPKEDNVGMTITVTNNTSKKLCSMELHALGGGMLWYYLPGKGNWDPGETATLVFGLKPGKYDVYIYACNKELVNFAPGVRIDDGGSYTVK